MSDKQALRDFQGRLAERLQAATQASGAKASWLAVEAGTARLLFPLDHAGQIFPWSAMQPMPYSPARAAAHEKTGEDPIKTWRKAAYTDFHR